MFGHRVGTHFILDAYPEANEVVATSVIGNREQYFGGSLSIEATVPSCCWIVRHAVIPVAVELHVTGDHYQTSDFLRAVIKNKLV
jgi:hypothetical protein